jgi:F-type H+-transporting ATPase subunit b
MPQLFQLSYVVWSQFLWLAIGLGFIFFVVARGMMPKIQATVDRREEKIASDLNAAQQARAAADRTEEAWRSRMDAARVEAARIAQEAKQTSARETEAQVRDSADAIDTTVAAAQKRVRDAIIAARAEIENIAIDATREMVDRLTGLQIDSKQATQAVQAEFHV